MLKESAESGSGSWSLHLWPLRKQKMLLFSSAAAVRLLLAAAFPILPDLLSGRVELSTPVTSFKRCTSVHMPDQYDQYDQCAPRAKEK